MRNIRRLTVFCGAATGDNPVYSEAAIKLGRLLAESKIGLVYGGGRVGLMGILANAALVGGGEVHGVIPSRLRTKEIAHEGLTELFEVDSMRSRKAMMARMGDAFVAMPGGFGTLEETFEAFTLWQLQYQDKPIGLLNINGYFDSLLAFLDHAQGEGFVSEEHRHMLAVADSPEELLEKLRTAQIRPPIFGGGA